MEREIFTSAGLIWLAFIIVGAIGKPFKMSAITAFGGGFLAAAFSLPFFNIFYEDGMFGLMAMALAIFVIWQLSSAIFGK